MTVLRQEDVLDQMIWDRRIQYAQLYLEEAGAVYYRGSAGEFIFVDPSLETKERMWAKAHELGHAMTGQSEPACASDAEANERMADRFAYSLLMPPERLLESCRLGIDSEEDLSDFLMMPLPQIVRGLELYRDQLYGPVHGIGDWRIQWLPLRAWRAGC